MTSASVVNDPARKGQRAGRNIFYGEHHRFAVYPVHTRLDAIQWFVADAETPDETGLASIVGQHFSFEDAHEHAVKLSG